MARPLDKFRYTVAKTILGSRAKDFIPALNPFNGIGFPGGRIKTYDDKVSQLTALTSWVFAANGAIADPCAAVELKLFRKLPDGDREEITDPKDPAMEILELMDTPNLVLTGEQLRQLHFTYMNLVGESYIIMRGKDGQPFIPTPGQLPAAMDIFPAHRVQFVLGKTYTESVVKLGQYEYPSMAFIRDLNPDPSNPYNGRSIVAAAAAAIGTNEQMKEWNMNMFANNARPSLIFTTNNEVSDEAYKRWKDQFHDEHTGLENAHKPLLIENGDAKPWMLSQSELEFLDSQKFTRDEILAMFRLNPAMLGIVENVNRATADSANYLNATMNVVPRVRQLIKQINATLVKVYDPNLELDFVNPVPEDEVAKLAAVKAGVNNWWTIDEARDMYGEDPLPDGLGEQIIFTGMNPTPLAQLLQEPQDDTPGDTEDTKPQEPKDDEVDPHLEDEAKALAGVKKKI